MLYDVGMDLGEPIRELEIVPPEEPVQREEEADLELEQVEEGVPA